MTPTKSGRRHDKRISDKFNLPHIIPQDVTIWADTGFQGIAKWEGSHLQVGDKI